MEGDSKIIGQRKQKSAAHQTEEKNYAAQLMKTLGLMKAYTPSSAQNNALKLKVSFAQWSALASIAHQLVGLKKFVVFKNGKTRSQRSSVGSAGSCEKVSC